MGSCMLSDWLSTQIYHNFLETSIFSSSCKPWLQLDGASDHNGEDLRQWLITTRKADRTSKADCMASSIPGFKPDGSFPEGTSGEARSSPFEDCRRFRRKNSVIYDDVRCQKPCSRECRSAHCHLPCHILTKRRVWFHHLITSAICRWDGCCRIYSYIIQYFLLFYNEERHCGERMRKFLFSLYDSCIPSHGDFTIGLLMERS
jgi:hypothetical protein